MDLDEFLYFPFNDLTPSRRASRIYDVQGTHNPCLAIPVNLNSEFYLIKSHHFED